MNREELKKKDVAFVFKKISQAINDGGCSFRKLIYDHLGFTADDYSLLYRSGGQHITNFIVEKTAQDHQLKELQAENAHLKGMLDRVLERINTIDEWNDIAIDSESEYSTVQDNCKMLYAIEVGNKLEELKQIVEEIKSDGKSNK